MFETKPVEPGTRFEEVPCDFCGSEDLEEWDHARSNRLSRCRKCGLVFTNPRIASAREKGRVLYSKQYFEQPSRMIPRLKAARKRVYRRERETIRRYAGPGRILDVGCGVGTFLETFGEEWEKYGTDVSEFAVAEARTRGIEAVVGEFETIDFPQCFFDVIVFRASLHHAYSPSRCLRKANLFLKPGGVVALLMTNNLSGLGGRLFKAHVRSYEQGHNFLFSASILRRYLEKFGFECVDASLPYFGTGYDSVGDWISLPFVYARYRLLAAAGRLNRPGTYDLASPALPGNYVNMLGRKRTEMRDEGGREG
ncbi:MAG: class I SAM-dependent methyltransferase [Candidatus Hydrogenedentota bacterium]|nr:MAG: class I SAM-dependent methyltransferase [Candidatus Hydrogenedentota bacterium]